MDLGRTRFIDRCPLMPPRCLTVRLWDEPFPRTNKPAASGSSKGFCDFIYLVIFHQHIKKSGYGIPVAN